MVYKFTTFVDAIQFGVDAWYCNKYNTERNGKKLDAEDMALFIRDVDGWANMFFGEDSEQAMDAINHETWEATSEQTKA